MGSIAHILRQTRRPSMLELKVVPVLGEAFRSKTGSTRKTPPATRVLACPNRLGSRTEDSFVSFEQRSSHFTVVIL